MNVDVTIAEKWSHRADISAAAVNDRHGARLWGLPRTNLALSQWPVTTGGSFFLRWNYWWQAHYLDCLIDGALRGASKSKKRRVMNTVRGMRVRSLGRITDNAYNDDKAWLTLAFQRMSLIDGLRSPKETSALEFDLLSGIDPQLGVLPWFSGSHYYNAATNGPAALAFARSGRLDQAIEITNWVFTNLLGKQGLIYDGMRLQVSGPSYDESLYPYCQGVMLGACMEIFLALRRRAGLDDPERTEIAGIEDISDDAARDEARVFLTRIRNLVRNIDRVLADSHGVLLGLTRGGDGGLFKGILARYLADVAVRLPEDSEQSLRTKRQAARLVMHSAESVWDHRLEVDGQPVFAANWTADAVLPGNVGAVGDSASVMASAAASAVRVVESSAGFFSPRASRRARLSGHARHKAQSTVPTSAYVPERDLTVQLSGWMLMEAAARVARAQESDSEEDVTA